MTAGAAHAATRVAEAYRHHVAGRLAEAEAGYLDALRLAPKSAEALHFLGVLRHQQGDFASAVKLISRAIKIAPGHAEMHSNLGSAHHKLGEVKQAIFAFRKAIAIKPMPDAYFNLGRALRDTDDLDGAAAAYRAYLKDNPEDAAGHLGLGRIYAQANRFTEAMTEYDHAIRANPELAEGYDKIGSLLTNHGHFRTSLPFYEQAVELAPDVAEWRFSLAMALLRLEKFSEGWPHYEARYDRDTIRVARRAPPPPHWNGEDLTEKSILVYMEQGVGDQILFASMLPDIIAQAGKCFIACNARLAPVYARSFPKAEIIPHDDLSKPIADTHNIDMQIGAGSLGRWLRSDLTRFPCHEGYLRADPGKVASLRSRYEQIAKGRRIVGISWRTRDVPDNAPKSIDLAGLAPVLRNPDTLFVNLQYGDCRDEIAAARKASGAEIFEDAEINPLKDMDAFFAQTAAMDLVVTSSNTAAHTAGAMNKPVWLMLPHDKGLIWYWFLERADSPWYPSARLFRARKPEMNKPWWDTAAEDVAQNLRTWTAQK